MQRTATRAKEWRVRLADGGQLELAGAKIVITSSGSLMVLDDVHSANPIRVIAAGRWMDCIELPRRAVTR